MTKATSTRTNLLQAVEAWPRLDRRVLGRLTPDTAISTMDYKVNISQVFSFFLKFLYFITFVVVFQVSDLQRRLNKLRSKSKEKDNYLSLLHVECEDREEKDRWETYL